MCKARHPTPKFACPRCGAYVARVKDSRPLVRRDGVERRRECVACGFRFTTQETIVGPRQVGPGPSNRHNR